MSTSCINDPAVLSKLDLDLEFKELVCLPKINKAVTLCCWFDGMLTHMKDQCLGKRE